MCRGDLFESGDRILLVTARPASLFSSEADRFFLLPSGCAAPYAPLVALQYHSTCYRTNAKQHTACFEVCIVKGTKTSPREKTFQRSIPPYHVILENDDYHTQTFVVSVLCKVLGHSVDRAFQLMLQAHLSGRAIVWSGPKEVAELKAEQIRTFREEPYGPLHCTIEAA